MQQDGEVRLSPAWRHALRVLLERGLEYGQIIQKSELVELLGLTLPVTAQDQQRFQLDFMGQFQNIRDELLEDHRLALKTLHGEQSYQVVPPNEQTDLAMGDGLREMKRVARKMVRTLAFIRHEELTDEERRKNADAQAKAAMLSGMIRNPRLPGPP